MVWLRRLALLLITIAPVLAESPLIIGAQVHDGWAAADGPDGPTGPVLRGQLRRVEVTLTNPGPDVVVLQSLSPETGLTTWFELPFGSVTRTGERATIDRSSRSHTHGGSMLTVALWPGESRKAVVAVRFGAPTVDLVANVYTVDLDTLAKQFYVAEPTDDGGEPVVYRKRSAGWLSGDRPVIGLWFHHDLDIDQGWPLTAGGERTDIPEAKTPQRQVTVTIGVPLEDVPATIDPGAVYSNAMGGWVNLDDSRRASLAAEVRAVRLASLSAEALDVLDAAPGPYPIRLAIAGAPPPGGLPEGVALIDEEGWQVALVPAGLLAEFLGWAGADGRSVTVREAYFDERPVFALR